MARCEDMRLLLGPFEDGELEAHEMQEVARHVVGCADCDGELADYRKFAVSLRSFATTPDLTGFRTAVVARIDDLPVPFGDTRAPLPDLLRGRYWRDFRHRIRGSSGCGSDGGHIDAVSQAGRFARWSAPSRSSRIEFAARGD